MPAPTPIPAEAPGESFPEEEEEEESVGAGVEVEVEFEERVDVDVAVGFLVADANRACGRSTSSPAEALGCILQADRIVSMTIIAKCTAVIIVVI